MAQKQHQDTFTIGFRSIQLLKDQTLGIGSYGSVCKVLCDDLLCAAKIIHPTLFDPNAHQQIERQREHRLPIRRFMQECEFMSAIRHPNIVQFLGTHQDPQTGLPVLLMELMDDSLTHFLESSQDALPYHIQVNFCHNITMAISYLHSNGITHRDLSSNNVLLRGNVIAKVTDFGMAKLGKINPQATRVSFTMCPGTDAYMPPEAVKDPPVYTEKIDCFAIGTLIIQILTRCFPKPGNRHKIIHTTDPRFPTIEARASEIERRQNHISLVDPNHPLLPIAINCLKVSDVERPTAQELCHRVAALKETPRFTGSVRRAQERPEPAGNITEREKELRQQVQDKDDIIEQRDQQIQGLQQIIGSQNNRLKQNNDIIRVKDNIIRNKDQTIVASQQECQQLRGTITDKQRQLQQVTQQLECSQKMTAKFQPRIQELEQQLKRKLPTGIAKRQLSLRDPPQTHHSDTSTKTATATRDSLTLRWREGKKAPCKMIRVSNAVVDGEKVYIRSVSKKVYAYNSRNKIWEQLPDCLYFYSSLVVIQNSLIAIGGSYSGVGGGAVTNQLLSLAGEGESKRWREVLPPMSTKRASSIAVTTGQALIVAGGLNQDKKRLRTVEIMNIDTKQWSSAAYLPELLSMASAIICGKSVYIVGGWSDSTAATKSVYTCTLADLFLSCQSRSLGQRSAAQSLSLTSLPRSTKWSKVADLPVTQSTCVTFHHQLLAIGGSDSNSKPTSSVYQYHPTSNTWEVISQMNTSRRLCIAAVLPTNELMVVGGYTTSSFVSQTDSVEIATVV